MDEILRDLARLRQYGTMLQELIGDLQRSAPEHSEGTDSSGTVRATLGPDGLPKTIRVSPYWKEKVSADTFGGAVMAACQAAMQQRGAQWSEVMQKSGWDERLEQLDADATTHATADLNPVPPAFRKPNGARPRPLDVLGEEAMSALDTAMKPAPAPQQSRGTGTNRGGTLEISVSAGGRVSCRADSRWVSQQSGAQLSEALATALAAAHERLAAATSAARASTPAGPQTDGLMADILAAISDPLSAAE
jgi:DNA-binding protein YbaB